MIFSANTILLSDGKRIAFACKTDKGILVYYSEDSAIKSLSVDQEVRSIDVTTLGSTDRYYQPAFTNSSINVNFEIFGKLEIGGEELLKYFITADSLSIEDLFKIIQNRIQERN